MNAGSTPAHHGRRDMAGGGCSAGGVASVGSGCGRVTPGAAPVWAPTQTDRDHLAETVTCVEAAHRLRWPDASTCPAAEDANQRTDRHQTRTSRADGPRERADAAAQRQRPGGYARILSLGRLACKRGRDRHPSRGLRGGAETTNRATSIALGAVCSPGGGYREEGCRRFDRDLPDRVGPAARRTCASAASSGDCSGPPPPLVSGRASISSGPCAAGSLRPDDRRAPSNPSRPPRLAPAGTSLLRPHMAVISWRRSQSSSNSAGGRLS